MIPGRRLNDSRAWDTTASSEGGLTLFILSVISTKLFIDLIGEGAAKAPLHLTSKYP
jgi:hypothetical protein